SNWNEAVDNIGNKNLKESLLWGTYAYGFEKLCGSNLSCLHWCNQCCK
ncbi:hypothetical protein FD755_000064, partial [Muntiacus reevesi]